jgi:WD40 repeat protein
LLTGDTRLQHKIDRMHFKAVAFTPDGRLLGAAHNGGTVRLYDTRSWHERACYNWKIGRATCLAFSPDGLRAAAGGGNGRIVVWDVDG